MSRTRYDDVEVTGRDDDFVRVIKHQQDVQRSLEGRVATTGAAVDARIAESEAILQRYGRQVELPAQSANTGLKPDLDARLRPWSEILDEARAASNAEVGLLDVLDPADISAAESRIAVLRGSFDKIHRMDSVDWCISGAAGALAALVDAFLVGIPSRPGFLGAPAVKGGGLSDFIRSRIRSAMSPEEISRLEREHVVPYDAAFSRGLGVPVPGLAPRTHRFHSLGHDPLLGFIFGVWDILSGRMTTIDAEGSFVSQVVRDAPQGMSIWQAILRQFGHLQSDVSTPAGLPAPLTPLLGMLQVGAFGDGEHKRTVGELARLMYAQGYDFGHFLAQSVTTALIEVLVRGAYAVKRLIEGHSLMDSLPIQLPGRAAPPRLNSMLFYAHLIATAANAGRVYLTGNPLAINYVEWIAFSRVAAKQLKWWLYEGESARISHVQASVDDGWTSLDKSLMDGWRRAPSDIVPRLGA